MRTCRIILYIFVALTVLFLVPLFIRNIEWLLNPNSLSGLASGHWELVAIYIILFSALAFFTLPRGQNQWRKQSIWYVAFIVALFAEMFGFPLTLYLLSGFVSTAPAPPPSVAFTFSFLGTSYDLLLTSLVAAVFSIMGAILIILGWKKVFNAKGLVTDGVYSYSRNPQYVGFSLIILSWMFAWPTIITMVLGAFLLAMYAWLGKKEENGLEKQYGDKFREYKKSVPFYF